MKISKSANIVALPTAERRSKEQRSAETQSAIVEAAIALLCEVGYAGTTLAEVARRAGCTTGAMQHHFGSKEQLMLAALRLISSEFAQIYAGYEEWVHLPLRERVAKMTAVLAAYYTAPRYVAVWDLYVGARCEASIAEVCTTSRNNVMEALQHAWFTVFGDAAASRTEQLALLDFVLTFLRNFGLNRSLGTASRSPARQLAYLEDVLLLNLQAKEPRRPGQPG